MKKLILIFYCMISCYSSCRSGQCDDPDKCESYDKTTNLKAIISNSDSVLHVGDTLRFYARVPDTLTTEEARIEGRTFNNQTEIIFVKSFYKKVPSDIAVDLLFNVSCVIVGGVSRD